jgi:hypothetical protein
MAEKHPSFPLVRLCLLLSVKYIIAVLELQVNALQREVAATDTQHVGKKKKGFAGGLKWESYTNTDDRKLPTSAFCNSLLY